MPGVHGGTATGVPEESGAEVAEKAQARKAAAQRTPPDRPGKDERATGTRRGAAAKGAEENPAGSVPASSMPAGSASEPGGTSEPSGPSRPGGGAGPGAGVPGGSAGAATLPVREGESAWTRAEVDAIRSELESELARQDREAAALQTNIDDVLRDTGGGVGDDQADSGAKAFEREQEMTLLATVRESRFQTERALRRIADGSYGRCESCGNPIGKLRLQAYPRATLCVSCKQQQERR